MFFNFINAFLISAAAYSVNSAVSMFLFDNNTKGIGLLFISIAILAILTKTKGKSLQEGTILEVSLVAIFLYMSTMTMISFYILAPIAIIGFVFRNNLKKQIIIMSSVSFAMLFGYIAYSAMLATSFTENIISLEGYFLSVDSIIYALVILIVIFRAINKEIVQSEISSDTTEPEENPISVKAVGFLTNFMKKSALMTIHAVFSFVGLNIGLMLGYSML